MKIPASRSYIQQLLNSHPNYPSLLSITDTLDELGIENTAIQIEKDQLREMPVPFLAHLNGNGGEFVIVKNRDNLDNQFHDFFKRWSGVAVAAETKEGWQHIENTKCRIKDNSKYKAIALTLAVLITFIAISGYISFNWIQTAFLLTAVTGFFISWMIVSKDMGLENKIADKVCGKTDDCNSVIHFGKLKLPLGIGLSDAGIIYFSFQLIASVIVSFTNSAGINSIFFLLATASLPVTLLSIYYQWRVIKKWCRLCLVTVALLWLQFLILLVQIISGRLPKGALNYLTINNVAFVLFLSFIHTAAWLWLKPLLQENKKLEKENFDGKRFKNNSDVFMALLEMQRKIDTTPFENDLQIGNPNAPLQILVACNPYCGPCAKAHEVLDKLVERNDIGLTVRLTVKTGNKEDKKLQAVNYMLQLLKDKDAGYKRKILYDWYALIDMEKFKDKYPLIKTEDTFEQLEILEKWSADCKIEFTPTIFINGYELPKQYTVNDLIVLKRIMFDNTEDATIP